MTSFLLDTHVWLWMLADSPRLGRRTRALVSDAANRLHLSMASAWEIAIKTQAGRLRAPLTSEREFQRQLDLTGVELVRIDLRHTLAAAQLPPVHADPFDRMIVAQARDLRCSLLSVDARVRAYDVDVIAD